ncbi:MAG: hypothetical protein ACE5E9_01915 [Nitrospinaceae bacterium]
MIGAIEILMIAVIFGIIYGRDAIDKTFKKHPDEGVMESFAEDVKEFYESDPKRLFKLIIFIVSTIAFLAVLGYWAATKTELPKLLGWN